MLQVPNLEDHAHVGLQRNPFVGRERQHAVVVHHGIHGLDPVRVLCGNDTVATRPRLSHEARRRSCGRIDGVTVASHRVDAIDAKFKLRD